MTYPRFISLWAWAFTCLAVGCASPVGFTAEPIAEPLYVDEDAELLAATTTFAEEMGAGQEERTRLSEVLVVLTNVDALDAVARIPGEPVRGHAEARGADGVVYVAAEADSTWRVFAHELLHVLLYFQNVRDENHSEQRWARVPALGDKLEETHPPFAPLFPALNE